jgi:hypothetical protein
MNKGFMGIQLQIQCVPLAFTSAGGRFAGSPPGLMSYAG